MSIFSLFGWLTVGGMAVQSGVKNYSFNKESKREAAEQNLPYYIDRRGTYRMRSNGKPLTFGCEHYIDPKTGARMMRNALFYSEHSGIVAYRYPNTERGERY